MDGDGCPVILPINYVMDGDEVLVRTALGETTEFAPRHRVAFEVDDIDELARTGWSVLVKGQARVITEDSSTDLEVGTWAPGPRNVRIGIRIELISGRQIVRPAGKVSARDVVPETS